MSANPRHIVDNAGSQRTGNLVLALGVLALAATAFTYVLSLTELVDPPNWVRAAALVWLPLGFFGAPVAYTFARNGPRQQRALLGLGVTGVALAAFVVLLFLVG